jgi:hypothetical protein
VDAFVHCLYNTSVCYVAFARRQMFLHESHGIVPEQVWPQMYEEELGPPPPILAAPCCAEFMVSRDRILAHPKSFYVHLRDWIAETEVSR